MCVSLNNMSLSQEENKDEEGNTSIIEGPFISLFILKRLELNNLIKREKLTKSSLTTYEMNCTAYIQSCSNGTASNFLW